MQKNGLYSLGINGFQKNPRKRPKKTDRHCMESLVFKSMGEGLLNVYVLEEVYGGYVW